MDINVKLSAIVDAMDTQFEDAKVYLNKKTGEILMPTAEDFEWVEEDAPEEDYPAWQREAIAQARDIFEFPDGYVALPDRFDIHEYRIMEKFCLSISDEELSQMLQRLIKGGGAFRRFKDAIHRYDIAEDWYAYRTEALKKIARGWCEVNGIAYEDA